jgi:hypothetical protein
MHNKRKHHNKGYYRVIMSDVYSSRELPRLTTRIASEINAWSNTEIHIKMWAFYIFCSKRITAITFTVCTRSQFALALTSSTRSVLPLLSAATHVVALFLRSNRHGSSRRMSISGNANVGVSV